MNDSYAAMIIQELKNIAYELRQIRAELKKVAHK
jgi:hypothetical protein